MTIIIPAVIARDGLRLASY